MRIILILFNFSFIISRMIIPIFGEGKFLGGRLLSNYFQFNSKDCKWNYDDFPLEPFLFLLRKKEEAERKIDFLIIIEKDDLLLRPSPLHDHIYIYTVSTSLFVTIIYPRLRSSPNLAVSIHPFTRFSLRSSVHFFCPIFSTVATRSPAERMHDKKGRFARIHIRRESHSRET